MRLGGAAQLGQIGQAVGLFAVTNIDDIVILALYFSRAAGRGRATLRVVTGRYLGFGAILAVAVPAALGVQLLSEASSRTSACSPCCSGCAPPGGPGAGGRGSGRRREQRGRAGRGRSLLRRRGDVRGGDNIAVYVLVFATAGATGLVVYCVVFLLLVAVWCLAGRFFATRQSVADALARWGHIVLPVVLVGLGLVILVQGRAFGL